VLRALLLALKVVSIIKDNKDKSQAYCQVTKLAAQIGVAEQEKDSKKTVKTACRQCAN